MDLSKIAWNQASPIYQAIIEHPFTQGLIRGHLSQEIFGYYIEQDALYLKEFAGALTLIAGRCQGISHKESFLKFAQEALVAEQILVHKFFREKLDIKETGKITPATLAYTSYLLRVCCLEPVEIGIAALLPCFWIYREVGLYVAQNSISKNPFDRWISTYSGQEFAESVHEAITLFDHFATTATDATRQRMCDVFYTSSLFEWHFWQDSYERRAFDDVSLGAD